MQRPGFYTQTFGQTAQDFPIGPGVKTRLYCPLSEEELRLEAVFGGQDALPFQVRGQGQDHIGIPGGVRPAEGHGH